MTKACLLLALCLPLAACVLPSKEKPPPLPPVGAQSVAQDKTRCERAGGQWAGRAGGGMLCFRTPADAGKTCSRATDCTAGCLAKSHSCAPITPLIGCQDLLDAEGGMITQCVN